MPICGSPATPGRPSACSVNPHGFRDALATTGVIDAPELIGHRDAAARPRCARARRSATTISPAAWKPPPPGTTPSPVSPTRVEAAERRDQILGRVLPVSAVGIGEKVKNPPRPRQACGGAGGPRGGAVHLASSAQKKTGPRPGGHAGNLGSHVHTRIATYSLIFFFFF